MKTWEKFIIKHNYYEGRNYINWLLGRKIIIKINKDTDNFLNSNLLWNIDKDY